MMRKYFPLEVSERLFIAVEEDDVVDAEVSLPPTITLRCTSDIIHDNYADTGMAIGVQQYDCVVVSEGADNT